MSEPKPFRIIKPEIRILGVDDGKFTPHTKGNVLVVGVVFRGGDYLDGAMHTTIAVDGMDATDKIGEMVNASPHRRQLRAIMLNGITFGGFNLVDIHTLNTLTGKPVIAITRDKPDMQAIHNALKNLTQTEERQRIVQAAGQTKEITCKGTKLYIGPAGISLSDAQRIIDLSSTRSCFPEPLRVAHIIASGLT